MGINMTQYHSVTSDIPPGGTERINHEDCPAGEDTRRRLYLTRPISNPDTLIGYCHNCQGSGFMKEGKWVDYRDRLHRDNGMNNTLVTTADFKPPTHMITLMRDWPVHAQGWVYKAKMDSVLIEKYGFQYDPTSDRVFIPRFKRTTHLYGNSLQAYQLRNTDPHKPNAPKYLTVCSPEDNGYTMMYNTKDALQKTQPIALAKVILVEDYVSGVAIVEAYKDLNLKTHALVNYGTKVNLEALHYLSKYGQVLVWLDNDSDHVIEQAHVMARTTRMLNTACEVFVNVTSSDPKHYSPTDIRDEIESWAWST